MKMKDISFLFLLSFLIIISNTSCAQLIKFDYDFVQYDYDSVEEKTAYKIDILIDLEKYIKVELIGKEEELTYHVLELKQKESDTERFQLSYNTTKNTVMWLTREQMQNQGKYISVQCSAYPCSYQINLYTKEIIDMNIGDQISYYITEYNKEMSFNIIKEYSYLTGPNEYITLWALGSKNISTKLVDYEKNLIKFSQKNIYNLKTNDLLITDFNFIVNGEEGDLVTVGGDFVYDEISTYNLTINYPEVIGFIKKDFSTNVCYGLQNTKENYHYYTSKDVVYLSGVFYDRIAEIYFKDRNGEEIYSTSTVINKGYFSTPIDGDIFEEYSLCVRFPLPPQDDEDEEEEEGGEGKKKDIYTDIDEIAFALQITDPSNAKVKTMIYNPQRMGIFYPRTVPEGLIGSYFGMQASEEAKYIDYSVRVVKGFPDIYFDQCTNFPLCTYDNEKLKQIKNPTTINDIASLLVENEKRSPISPIQNIIVVNCTEAKVKKDANIEKVCEINTLIYGSDNIITLNEGELISQFIKENQEHKYSISHKGENNIIKIYVDIMLFTGDIQLEVVPDIGVKKYQNANKIYYSIVVDSSLERKDNILLVRAKKNSYYSLIFTFIREEDDSWMTNVISTGINYLVTINPEGVDSKGVPTPSKIIKFQNLRQTDMNPFMVNFHSLNCKLFITAKRMENNQIYDEPLTNVDYFYAQDILTNDMTSYFLEYYEYTATVAEMDFTKSNKRLCMTYVSALESQKKGTLVERQIEVIDNVLQQIIFRQGYNNVKYLYANPSPNEDIVIRFSFIDKSKYDVKIFIEKKFYRNYTIINNGQIYLSANATKDFCIKDQVCSFIIDVTCDELFIPKEPRLETAIKMVTDQSPPTYLIKNKIITDYLNGNIWQYYYVDIGDKESGEIILNLFRGSGNIYAKIVQKNQTIPDENADWKAMYRFPKDKDDSLFYARYLKQIIYNTKDYECVNGCYLLISIKINVDGDISTELRQFAYSLLVQSRPIVEEGGDDYDEIPLISIPLEKYIIGNVQESNDIYMFYSVYFPHDADKIQIDFQSDLANIYINIDSESEKPSLKEGYDFIFESTGYDNLYEISKEDFLKVALERGIVNEDETNIKGLSIIIGIWTNITDTFNNSVYSMKVHLPLQSEYNIYEVNSDQKTLCHTSDIDNKQTCLYMIIYEEKDTPFDLLIYPSFKDQSVLYEMHSNFIIDNKYEIYDKEYIEEKIPSINNAEFSTIKTKKNYMLLNIKDKKGYYLFLSVTTNKPTIVELMTSFCTGDKEITPNPSTSQLYIIKSEYMKFNFITEEDLLINFISINGVAEIYWETEPEIRNKLQLSDDHLSITSSIINSTDINKNKERRRSKLVIKNLYPIKKKDPDIQYEFFGFYMNYFLRPANLNIDELPLGKSIYYAYRNTDLPISLYTKLTEQKNNVNIYISLEELIPENQNKQNINQDLSFDIYASVVKEVSIYKLKKENIINLDNKKKGIYDKTKKTAFISLTAEDIQNYKINDKEHPTIIVQLIKNNKKNNLNFQRLSIQATAFQDNSEIPISEQIYQYGNLLKNTQIKTYKLKVIKNRRIIRIEFSSNSPLINWAISKSNISLNTNDTFTDLISSYVNGRSLVTFRIKNDEEIDFIYFSVFCNSSSLANDNNNINSLNFVLKYTNYELDTQIKEYKVPNNALKIINGEKNKKYILINPVISTEKFNISYFVKFIPKEKINLNENLENIAISEIDCYVHEFVNPLVENEKIKLDISSIGEQYQYLHIVAKIKDEKYGNEFIAYESVFSEGEKKDKNNNIIIYIIGAFCVIALVVIFIMIKNKIDKKDLLNEVNKTSFMKENEEKEKDEKEDKKEGLLQDDNEELK